LCRAFARVVPTDDLPGGAAFKGVAQAAPFLLWLIAKCCFLAAPFFFAIFASSAVKIESAFISVDQR
jgi:hypothetical protein